MSTESPLDDSLHLLSAPAIGIYVHVPFCARRCPYCDFTIVVNASPPVERYHAALESELQSRLEALHGRTVRSIYFGGGTPSASGADALTETLGAIRRMTGARPAEVTLEINPEDAPHLNFDALARAGFDRVSVGAQSFDDDALRFLGRQHDADDVRRAVEMARRAGFRNVSIDLIHGLPHDAPDRLKRDLEAIASLAPEHVSVYELTIEPKTRFARLRAQDLLPTVDEERLVSETERIESSLEAIGIRRYEVSNYARAGAEAVHNAAYWRGDEYLGLGVGAHSFSWDAGRGIRRENTRSIRRYLADPAEAADRVETLEETELLAELILVGMRTSRGIDLVGLARMFPKAVGRLPPLVDEWVKRGLATADGTWVKPTSRGLLVADNFASDAIDVLCDG